MNVEYVLSAETNYTLCYTPYGTLPEVTGMMKHSPDFNRKIADALEAAYENAKHTQSNADRIRAMSDEELAEFIGGIFTVERDVWGDYDPRLVVTQEPRVEVRDKEDMMDWLQSPADGEENGS